MAFQGFGVTEENVNPSEKEKTKVKKADKKHKKVHKKAGKKPVQNQEMPMQMKGMFPPKKISMA